MHSTSQTQHCWGSGPELAKGLHGSTGIPLVLLIFYSQSHLTNGTMLSQILYMLLLNHFSHIRLCVTP